VRLAVVPKRLLPAQLLTILSFHHVTLGIRKSLNSGTSLDGMQFAYPLPPMSSLEIYSWRGL